MDVDSLRTTMMHHSTKIGVKGASKPSGLIHGEGLEVNRDMESSSFEGTLHILDATDLLHWKKASGGIEPRSCIVSNKIQVWTRRTTNNEPCDTLLFRCYV